MSVLPQLVHPAHRVLPSFACAGPDLPPYMLASGPLLSLFRFIAVPFPSDRTVALRHTAICAPYQFCTRLSAVQFSNVSLLHPFITSSDTMLSCGHPIFWRVEPRKFCCRKWYLCECMHDFFSFHPFFRICPEIMS